MNIIRNIAVPTGDDLDDVNPEALLFMTEKTILTYFSRDGHGGFTTRLMRNDKRIHSFMVEKKDDGADDDEIKNVRETGDFVFDMPETMNQGDTSLGDADLKKYFYDDKRQPHTTTDFIELQETRE